MDRYKQGLRFSLTLLCGLIPSCRIRRFIYRHVFHVKIGRGSVIYGGADLRWPWNIEIGEHTSIGHRAYLHAWAPLRIGNNVNLGTGVWIFTGQHDIQSPDFASVVGPVVIEDYVYLGPRSIILMNVHVGEGAVVAAGSLVTKDVPPYAIVVGVPARVCGWRNRDLRYQLTWFQPFF